MIKPVQYSLCLSRLVGGNRLGSTFLQNADLMWADLRGANLRYTGLSRACLIQSDLREADLSQSDLTGAILLETDLQGANLRGAIKFDKQAPPMACALAKVGAPWECIEWEWLCDSTEWDKPGDYDHWAGVAKLYMLGQESD